MVWSINNHLDNCIRFPVAIKPLRNINYIMTDVVYVFNGYFDKFDRYVLVCINE